jgi:serpin B
VETLNTWTSGLRERKIEVYLPKFKLTSSFRLEKTLGSMGMPLAFSAKADFSGMDGKQDLSISAVIHKAFVDVNEEGTEAAAATAVVMTRMAAMRPAVFRADHPFLFLIRDNRTGSILFLGRVMNPKE